jgi:hypothetical protein
MSSSLLGLVERLGTTTAHPRSANPFRPAAAGTRPACPHYPQQIDERIQQPKKPAPRLGGIFVADL